MKEPTPKWPSFLTINNGGIVFSQELFAENSSDWFAKCLFAKKKIVDGILNENTI